MVWFSLMLCLSVFENLRGSPKQPTAAASPHHHTQGHPQRAAGQAEARKELIGDATLSAAAAARPSPRPDLQTKWAPRPVPSEGGRINPLSAEEKRGEKV